MEILYSIQTSDKIFNTGGSHPVLITCNDFNDYVCKYNIGNGTATRLACEYISASFLKLWELSVPDFALVNVAKDHIPVNFRIRDSYFDTTCFGSKYSKDFADLHNFTDIITQQQRKSYINRHELYYISLFDIWMANDDRNHNNYNLLIDFKNQKKFIPIDHEAIFNTRIINNPIYELSYEDSLVSSPLIRKMFSLSDFRKLKTDDMQDHFYFYVNQCKENLVYILDQLPKDWKTNKKELETKMLAEIFNEAWLKKSFKLLLYFSQQNFNHK